jgi:hypothetical protein
MNQPQSSVTDDEVTTRQSIVDTEVDTHHPYCDTVSTINGMGWSNPVNAISVHTSSALARASIQTFQQPPLDVELSRNDGLRNDYTPTCESCGAAFDALSTTPTWNSSQYSPMSSSRKDSADSDLVYSGSNFAKLAVLNVNFHVPLLPVGASAVLRFAYTLSTVAFTASSGGGEGSGSGLMSRVQEQLQVLARQADIAHFPAEFLTEGAVVSLLVRPLRWAVSSDASAMQCLGAARVTHVSLHAFSNTSASWVLVANVSSSALSLTTNS